MRRSPRSPEEMALVHLGRALAALTRADQRLPEYGPNETLPDRHAAVLEAGHRTREAVDALLDYLSPSTQETPDG